MDDDDVSKPGSTAPSKPAITLRPDAQLYARLLAQLARDREAHPGVRWHLTQTASARLDEGLALAEKRAANQQPSVTPEPHIGGTPESAAHRTSSPVPSCTPTVAEAPATPVGVASPSASATADIPVKPTKKLQVTRPAATVQGGSAFRTKTPGATKPEFLSPVERDALRKRYRAARKAGHSRPEIAEGVGVPPKALNPLRQPSLGMRLPRVIATRLATWLTRHGY